MIDMAAMMPETTIMIGLALIPLIILLVHAIGFPHRPWITWFAAFLFVVCWGFLVWLRTESWLLSVVAGGGGLLIWRVLARIARRFISVKRLSALLQSSNKVAPLAAQSLAADSVGFASLVEASRDENHEVRRAAAVGFAVWRHYESPSDPFALERILALERLIRDSSGEVREVAEISIKALSGQCEKITLEWMKEIVRLVKRRQKGQSTVVKVDVSKAPYGRRRETEQEKLHCILATRGEDDRSKVITIPAICCLCGINEGIDLLPRCSAGIEISNEAREYGKTIWYTAPAPFTMCVQCSFLEELHPPCRSFPGEISFLNDKIARHFLNSNPDVARLAAN